MADQGPNMGNLRRLREMMPSFISGIHERKTVGKGTKAVSRHARKICPVCLDTHDFVQTADPGELKKENCNSCAEKLAEGYTAFINGDMFCFARSERLKDLAGSVQNISKETMMKLSKSFDAEWRKPNESKNTTPEA